MFSKLFSKKEKEIEEKPDDKCFESPYGTFIYKHGHIKFYTKAVIENYDLVETDTELYITERVNNTLFIFLKN